MTRNASPLVTALEGAWEFLQGRYPELPDTVIVLGSGAGKGGMTHWGTWTPRAWKAGKKTVGEFMLAGERNTLGAEQVYETVLHEAAHALAEGRGIKDTSRQGRYHNTKFKAVAEELGLTVEKDPGPYGWAFTSYKANKKDEGESRILRSIKDALKIERPIPPQEDIPPSAPVSALCECGCPRKLRLKDKTRDEGPVICGICDTEFVEVR